MKKYLFAIFFFSLTLSLSAQHHDASHQYIWPSDSLVGQKLHHWQDIKFGLMMHWGAYSQWGIVESWSLCPEDEPWCQRRGPYSNNWYEYVKAYEGLQTTFNPVQFAPEKWAAAAKEAGMKYLVFTTKHHDGFCMFDTRQTDYKITDAKSPFSNHPRANVTKEIFQAFREQDFMIGAYFSKPDWHSNDYWWPYFPPKDRNPSYDPAKYPERWESFKNFTYNQIRELMEGYGKVDILWLDGGWVRPKETIDPSVSWQKSIPYSQDIDMRSIAAMARKRQPGLLVVDRTVSGEFENYVTPEQQVPTSYLPYPWESCITMGNSWSYVPNDKYKPAATIIRLLTDIVSRGGNLLLNIAPGPDGEWDPTAYERLQEVGAWMKVNGEAIYETQGDSLYGPQEQIVFTRKDGITYAIYRANDGETAPPARIRLTNFSAPEKGGVQMLGIDKKLKWVQQEKDLVISVPESIRKQPPCPYAWVFKISTSVRQ
ncbi:MAG: alpha-L-fucosidase [Lewinellaceae bacterium]|nr:alpha-L-fucosidase [Lewinellaceae bacterium]